MQKVQAEEQSEVQTQRSPGGTEKKHKMRELTQLFISWSLCYIKMFRHKYNFKKKALHTVTTSLLTFILIGHITPLQHVSPISRSYSGQPVVK
jgi:hypothetical protein